MDFSLNDDHLALRDAVQRFCDGEYPAEHRGSREAPPQTAQRWAGMAELGLLGLPFAADVGGAGQGSVEVMLVAQELGRVLGGGAFIASTVMAGQLLSRLASPARCRRLRGRRTLMPGCFGPHGARSAVAGLLSQDLIFISPRGPGHCGLAIAGLGFQRGHRYPCGTL